eukprot:2997575-Rhodomonas_salina.1
MSGGGVRQGLGAYHTYRVFRPGVSASLIPTAQGNDYEPAAHCSTIQLGYECSNIGTAWLSYSAKRSSSGSTVTAGESESG